MSNNSKPVISVIMPAYNAAKYLGTSIQSILNQTYSDFEFIIINDTSTDNTAQILSKYQAIDSRISIITHTKNTGIVGALNDGLDVAVGKYIARMDDDDISMPDRFEKQIEFLESNSDTFLIGTGAMLIDEEGNDLRFKQVLTGSEQVKKAIEKVNAPIHPSIMFRNGFGYKYRSKIINAEDLDLYLRLILDGKVIDNLNLPLIKYRLRPNSLSFGDYICSQQFVAIALQMYRNKIETGNDGYEEFDSVALKAKVADLFDIKRKEYGQIRYNFIVNQFDKVKELCDDYIGKYGFDKRIKVFKILSMMPRFFIEIFRFFYQM
jgi:glycosyltransferase involved in cell wall biosynthesis